jgi:hypothetical protein
MTSFQTARSEIEFNHAGAWHLLPELTPEGEIAQSC